MPIRGQDAEAQATRGLLAAGRTAGLDVVAERIASRPWASATFVGTQIAITLVAPRAPQLGRWLADLPLAEIPMRGYLLASLALEAIEDDGMVVRASLTALVIEG